MSKYFLAGDIGGTNSRLMLVELRDQNRFVLAEKSYRSSDFAGVKPLIDAFITEYEFTMAIDAACLAVAGPVLSGVAKVTNLPWEITETQLSACLQTPHVKLINDFVAAAYGVLELPQSEMLLLQQGATRQNPKLNVDAVVIGAGTGFGAAHLVYVEDHYQVYSSETGHTGFAPENPLQTQLLAWLQKQHSHVWLEMVLSGSGLSKIYQFLHEEIGIAENKALRIAMQETDPAQVIVDNALADSDELCKKTLELFIAIYGATAGNIVLHYYPVDELYIAGGIAPKISESMTDPSFLNAFQDKGLMSENMQKVTIRVVLQDKVGLYGALSQAMQL